ncbi:MAG TPA: ATP-binding protein [Solirubrobacteraceae bacterium]|jgi:anti-sigma regulatory factor (Ser/Thr protein kinase)|nr:ATP-binding protein [Solirubrobacteraceae bacterium]
MSPPLSPEPSPTQVPEHAPAHTFGISYLAVAGSVARGRRAVRAFAEAEGATPAVLDDITLASSEAITNVVQHAYPGAEGEVHVSARARSRRLCIAVVDHGRGLAHVTPRPGLGRGLDVMRHVSHEMALESRLGGGVEVRLGFDLGERAP